MPERISWLENVFKPEQTATIAQPLSGEVISRVEADLLEAAFVVGDRIVAAGSTTEFAQRYHARLPQKIRREINGAVQDFQYPFQWRGRGYLDQRIRSFVCGLCVGHAVGRELLVGNGSRRTFNASLLNSVAQSRQSGQFSQDWLRLFLAGAGHARKEYFFDNHAYAVSRIVGEEGLESTFSSEVQENFGNTVGYVAELAIGERLAGEMRANRPSAISRRLDPSMRSIRNDLELSFADEYWDNDVSPESLFVTWYEAALQNYRETSEGPES